MPRRDRKQANRRSASDTNTVLIGLGCAPENQNSPLGRPITLFNWGSERGFTMARARNIKPSFFKNELLGQADPLLSLLFVSLWTLADREGRLEDRPLRIKAETFPYREVSNFNGYLTELEQHGFIERYKVGDLAIIQIVNFRKHQAPHNTEKQSELPCKPVDMLITVKPALSNDEQTQAKRPDSLIPDSLNTDSLNPDSPNPDTGFPSKDLSAHSAQTSKKGTALPADWFLPKEWGQWALAEKPEWTADDVRRVAADFKDHWIANANQAKAKKADWLATWRKWVRSPLNDRKASSQFKTAGERRMAVTDAAIAEWLGEGEGGSTIEGECSHA